MRNRIMILWMGVMLWSFMAQGSVPGLINYQAFLTASDSEDPMEGPVTLTFSMYDDATDGTVLWREIHQMDVEGGMVQVMLGSLTPLSASLFDQDAVYLGLKIGDEAEMLPRKRIVSTPYALISDSTLSVSWDNIKNNPLCITKKHI